MEWTAYPRIKRLITAHELHLFFAPTRDEVEWVSGATDCDQHLLALLLMLKSYQRMGFPEAEESACVRCFVLRLDLAAQEPWLLEIEANTSRRLGEAQRMQWLGEVAGLQESLRHIADKEQQAERLRAQTGRGEDGVAALG
ncbi:DUF4158 domain-containing protein [Streptomyces sp. NBC_00820]|uniref:DUF4158 domain-containing protein n=1 Tax=Streptomyces sp. NBC_00820 TaxID=2975842 RepID=UPI002ED14863|nr:DUF4158 domain-containing protein [Streptomyces sp. NBC_00820]